MQICWRSLAQAGIVSMPTGLRSSERAAGRKGAGMKRPVEIAQLRLIAKVARMYHEGGVRQPQIATELNMSQARVSRLLRQASEIGVVRTVVTLDRKSV